MKLATYVFSNDIMLFVGLLEYTYKQKYNFEKKKPAIDKQKPEQNNNGTNIM